MKSTEINEWISQFEDNEKPIARLLLQQLEFISRDQYSSWLQTTINSFSKTEKYALFSVRKLDHLNPDLWSDKGKVLPRPGESQGSEDLVYSLVANLVRQNKEKLLFDHPSLNTMKDNRIKNLILIDDSIGSGHRITTFINGMLKHPTFLSWWSYGFIRIHIVAFARQLSAEHYIISFVRGSNSFKRKFPVSSKISFISEKVYEHEHLQTRWGIRSNDIKKLCRDKTVISSNFRFGYGSVMSNLVFYHSVPNNIPALVWYDKPHKWQALLPGRTLPQWMVSLLNDRDKIKTKLPQKIDIPSEMILALKLIKSGVRRSDSLSFRLNREISFVETLILKLDKSGFITPKLRITKAGVDMIKTNDLSSNIPLIDDSMYIPSSWCID